MRRQLLTGALLLAVMTVALGLVYPLLITGVGQVAFGYRADGSIVEVDGEPVASELIGQSFDGDEWFHSRPSAAGDGYDGSASSGSNLGPTSEDLLSTVAERVAAYRAENGLGDDVAVPADAVTGSGSGLDPHISLANARFQAPRVAAARGLELGVVLALVDDNLEARPAGVLGDDGVNVVRLNLALQEAGGR